MTLRNESDSDPLMDSVYDLPLYDFLQPRRERPDGMARRRVDRSEGMVAPSQLRDTRPPEHG